MKSFAFCLLASVPLLAFEAWVEGKAGYFLPTNHEFRSAYGKDGVIGTLESTFQCEGNFYPWASVSYYTNTGHPHDQQSRLYFIPIGVGLKYLYSFTHFSLYAGAGALPTYLHIRNNSSRFQKRETDWGCGAVIKTGILSNRLYHLFLDLFVEYTYLNIHHDNKSATSLNPVILNNFSIGGGIGYHFGCPECKPKEE